MRGWNTIKRILDQNLSKAACLQEVARYKRKEREMRRGKIIKKNDGGFYVEIEIEKERPVIAVCGGNHVGVHERDELMVGQRRAFHLRRVEPVMVLDTPRIKVVVDRVSKTLVENLLQSQLGNRKAHIRCLNRYVGHKSFVESSRFLPKTAILMAGLCKEAGVQPFTFHALRHAGASTLENNHVSIGSIQRILGHENRTTTEIYLHCLGNAELDAMRILERSRSFSHTDSHTEQKKHLAKTMDGVLSA